MLHESCVGPVAAIDSPCTASPAPPLFAVLPSTVRVFGVRSAGIAQKKGSAAAVSSRISNSSIAPPPPDPRVALQLLLCEAFRHAEQRVSQRLQRRRAGPDEREVAFFQLECTWRNLHDDVAQAMDRLTWHGGDSADALQQLLPFLAMLELFQRYAPRHHRVPKGPLLSPPQVCASASVMDDAAGAAARTHLHPLPLCGGATTCVELHGLSTSSAPDDEDGSNSSSSGGGGGGGIIITSKDGGGGAATPLDECGDCGTSTAPHSSSSSLRNTLRRADDAHGDSEEEDDEEGPDEGTVLWMDCHVPLEWAAVAAEDVRRGVVEARRARKLQLLRRLRPGHLFLRPGD